MKLKLLNLLLLGNQALFAGTMGSASHELTTDAPSRWSLGGKAIYLQPSLNDLRFANRQTITTVDDASSTWKNNLQYS